MTRIKNADYHIHSLSKALVGVWGSRLSLSCVPHCHAVLHVMPDLLRYPVSHATGIQLSTLEKGHTLVANKIFSDP